MIQMEEPQIHLLAARGIVDNVINPEFMLKVFNNTVKGLRAKTEVWCHTCWGNPSQQRMFKTVQSYKPALEVLNQVDADVITFEMKSSNAMDLEDVGQCDHRQEGRASASSITTRCRWNRRRKWPTWSGRRCRHIPAERLVVSSDCGMGREGMSRRHAFYKMVALVQGTNIVRQELGLPVAESSAQTPGSRLFALGKIARATSGKGGGPHVT